MSMNDLKIILKRKIMKVYSCCQSIKFTNYVKACERKGIGVDERSYNYFKTQCNENILILAVYQID